MFTVATMAKILPVLLGVILWLAKKASERSAALQAQRAASGGADAGAVSRSDAASDSGQASRSSVSIQTARDGRQPKVLARGKGGRKAAGAKPAKAPAQFGDSSSAMQSRQHLVEQVARIKAAEAKIAGAGRRGSAAIPTKPVSAPGLPVPGLPVPGLSAGELRRSLANPAAIRKAIVLGEILGRPRADRAI